jgi:hypothetical protein
MRLSGKAAKLGVFDSSVPPPPSVGEDGKSKA